MSYSDEEELRQFDYTDSPYNGDMDPDAWEEEED